MRVFLGDVGLCIVESVEGYSSLEERSEGEEGVGNWERRVRERRVRERRVRERRVGKGG